MIDINNWRISKQTWIALIALVTILPVILWIYFKCLCTRYNAKCPVLMKNQFFILGVLIGQCKIISFFTLL
jgi:hypothetical protein